MSTDLNMEYQEVKFGDICREVKLTTKDPIADGYDKYIGLEHLDSGSLKIKRWGLIAEDNPTFTRVFKKGHILIGKRRPYLKKAAIAEFDGICSSDIIVVEASNNQLFKKILPFLIQSEKFWNWAIKTSNGSLSPRTKFKDIQELKLLIPKDISVTNFYAELLSKTEECIEKASLSHEAFKLFKNNLSENLLEGKERIPGYKNDWKKKKLKDLGVFLRGLTYSPSDVTDNTYALLVLRSSNIKDGLLTLDDNVYVDNEGLQANLVKKNDILICVRNGSKHLIGKTALINEDIYATHGAFMSLYRTEYSQYIYHLFQTKRYKELVSMNLGATINSINGSDLENFSFFVPEKSEMDAISKKLSLYNDVDKSLHNKCINLINLRNNLVNQYLG